MSEQRPAATWMARNRMPLGLAAAAVALALAVLWCFVVPDKAATTEGLHSAAIRWAHPLCWALLAGAALSHAVAAPTKLRDGLLWSALASYAVFLGALFL